ncbi:hypothetical protein F5Y18DRAFT_150470 [Xylariaceae sp. FL1019]|nr:hypothetical protein F5Y18DRAFT_150470 [Xylariaceae sp. FL1019]
MTTMWLCCITQLLIVDLSGMLGLLCESPTAVVRLASLFALWLPWSWRRSNRADIDLVFPIPVRPPTEQCHNPILLDPSVGDSSSVIAFHLFFALIICLSSLERLTSTFTSPAGSKTKKTVPGGCLSHIDSGFLLRPGDPSSPSLEAPESAAFLGWPPFHIRRR